QNILRWNMKAPHYRVFRIDIVNRWHRKPQGNERIFRPVKKTRSHSMVLRKRKPVPQAVGMLVHQVQTAPLKVGNHFALDTFNVRYIVTGNLWKQRLVDWLSAVKGEVIRGNIEDDVLVLLKTVNSICFVVVHRGSS